MEVLPSPGLTPTSQHAGTTSDNSAAMTAAGSDPGLVTVTGERIPVSTQRQPTAGVPHQAGKLA